VQSASASAPAAAEDEDEVDLFGDDDEEDDAEAERLKAERVAAYNAKKANKPKAAAKVGLFVCFYIEVLMTIVSNSLL
jgi:elongation factor 1-beta